jgi:hypothetical protein
MSITKIAEEFLTACETGKGWSVCSAYCTPGATFSAQAEPLAEVSTVEQYTNWMQGMLTVLTDGTYDVKSLATDAERNNVSIYAVFTGTHLAGGPIPPTKKTTKTDYVYSLQFDGDKISYMTKIWNSGFAMKELGWA